MVKFRENLDLMTLKGPPGGGAVEWRISDSPVDYLEAVAAMESRAAAIAAQEAPELVWLLEHPPLYTSGTSGKAGDLLDPRFPLFSTGRGGQLTYHGPGQRVAYVLLDLKRPDKGAGFEDKIAAIGVRLRRWVSFHGIAINVEPDLSHFSAIVPCGVADPRYGVTSLVDLGHPVTMADVDVALRRAFEEVFGAIEAQVQEAQVSEPI